MGDERDPLAELRVLLEEGVEGGEPAKHVLGEVGPVDPQDQVVAAAAQELLLVLGDLLGGGGALEAPRVDAQRIGAHPGLAARVQHRAALVVDLELHQLTAAVQEVAAVGGRVEADDVVGEHAPVDLLPPLHREDPPAVRLGPRDVDEVVEEGVRPRLADQSRAGVEVVVVEHHQRLVVALDGSQHRPGDVVVHHPVAVLPGVRLVGADVRRVREVPQVVLDEPEDRVGDDAVEAVVGLGVGLDQEHLVGDAVELDGCRTPVRFAGHRNVLVGHRRGDPQRVAVRDQALSAVTSPPPPRRTMRSPASVRSNSAGPRLETITS